MHVFRCAGVLFLLSWVVGLPALAQSPSLRERILANPRAEIDKAISVVERPDYRQHRGGEIAINWCHIYPDWGETADDDFIDHFQHVAHEHVNMRQLLYANGYPPESYRNELAGITLAYLREIVRRRSAGLDLRDISGIKRAILPFEKHLAESMTRYREQTDATVARPTVWEQCGGDYVGFVKIKSLPDGGTVRLIREFYYKLCQVSGIRPFSDNCDKWSVIASTRDVPGGIYYYLVSWPGGHAECDRIEFTGASPNEDDKVVTIRQSGRGCAQ
jgi:hypothetical protein